MQWQNFRTKMFFTALFLASGMLRGEEIAPQPVSSTVTLQLLTIYTDDSSFRPRITLDKML